MTAKAKALSVCLCLAAAIVVAGCDKKPAPVAINEVSKQSHASAIQVRIPPRTNTWFTNAVLWKPEPQTLIDTNAISSVLAPLLMQEVSGSKSTDEFGVFPTGVDRELKPSTDIVTIGGQHHARITYRFFVSQTNDQPHEMGIRMTLNSDGLPAIWEAIDLSNNSKQVYVSRYLEDKAAKEHGRPIQDNHFSIESRIETENGTRVARVLEDAPVPMGPILYVNLRGEVETVICRCMPGQASAVVGTGTYKLVHETSQGATATLTDAPPTLRYPSRW